MSKMIMTSTKHQSGKIMLRHMLLLVILVVGLIILFRKGFFPSMDSIPVISSISQRMPEIKLPESLKPSFNFDDRVKTPTGEIITPPSPVPAARADGQPEVVSEYTWRPPTYDDTAASNPDTADTSTKIFTPRVVDNPRPTPTPMAVTIPPKPVATPAPAPKPRYPDTLEAGYYTVQVHAGYNSKEAYNIAKQLKKDGYQSYIAEQENREGQLFRVRVGQYRSLNNARAIRDQIRRRYPKRLSDSFVLLRQQQS